MVSKTTEWKAIARKLQISQTTIDFIATDKDNSKDCFVEVLERWRKECKRPYTWEEIVSVLKSPSVNEISLAQQLSSKYCK